MTKISACIIVKNEEKAVRDCLESIENVVDEIIIVDEHSSDRTVEICREYTLKIYLSVAIESFAEKKNFSLSKSSGDWILVINTDEKLSEGLQQLIQKVKSGLNLSKYDAYAFLRRNYITPDGIKQIWLKHGLFYPDYQIRLSKNKKEIRY
jgi:glycosyltransferase involved in cell wall biosynthesis